MSSSSSASSKMDTTSPSGRHDSKDAPMMTADALKDVSISSTLTLNDVSKDIPTTSTFSTNEASKDVPMTMETTSDDGPPNHRDFVIDMDDENLESMNDHFENDECPSVPSESSFGSSGVKENYDNDIDIGSKEAEKMPNEAEKSTRAPTYAEMAAASPSFPSSTSPKRPLMDAATRPKVKQSVASPSRSGTHSSKSFGLPSTSVNHPPPTAGPSLPSSRHPTSSSRPSSSTATLPSTSSSSSPPRPTNISGAEFEELISLNSDMESSNPIVVQYDDRYIV